MKKIFIAGLWLVVLATAVPALSFIGAREAGMGGCGASVAVGPDAVVYNPAGFMENNLLGLKLSVGAASRNPDQISSALSSFNDLSDYLVNNLNNQLDANGYFSGLVCIDFNKIGISAIIPDLQARLYKPAGTITGDASAASRYDVAVTLGTTFKFAGLPIKKLDVGTNLKLINYVYGRLNAEGSLPLTATESWGQGAGFGVDLGARAQVEIPLLTNFAVGLAVKDLAASVNVQSPQSRTDTFNADNTVTQGPTVTGSAQQYNYPTNITLGCSGNCPLTGLLLALDYESISGGSGSLANTDAITHFGMEYPTPGNLLVLRAGLAASQNIARNTLGVQFNLPFVIIAGSGVWDCRDALNNQYVVDAGFTF